MRWTLLSLLLLFACSTFNNPSAGLAREAREALDRGEKEEAVRLAEAAIDAQPNAQDKVNAPHGEALYVIGSVTAQRGEKARAVIELREAVRYDPLHEPAWVLLAGLQRELKLDDDAVRAYEQCVWLDPDNDVYRSRLCWAHIDLKHEEAAVATCAMAAEKGPNNPDARGGYAVALTRVGKTTEAEAERSALNGMLAAVRDPVLADVEKALKGERTGR